MCAEIRFFQGLLSRKASNGTASWGKLMRNRGIEFVGAACTAILLVATGLSAQEKKIQRSDLPPAVEKTVIEQSQGAKIRGFSQEVENGATYYEAELTVDGHTKDVLIDKDGKVVEVEEQVAVPQLPPAVRDGLRAKAGKGKLTKVESIKKRDRLVAYEAQVLTGEKHSEIQVGPDGKPLDHEE